MAHAARVYVEDMPDPAEHDLSRPIDLVHLAHQTFGERDLEAELLRLFDRQSTQILARLTDGGLSEGRWCADLAHSLKGSARAIGAFGVAAAAEAYETTARNGGDSDPALGALSAAVAAAHVAIGDLLGG